MTSITRDESLFVNGLDTQSLIETINLEINFNGRLISVCHTDGVVGFLFSSYTPTTDDAMLDSIISSHSSDPYKDIIGYPDFTLSGGDYYSTTNSSYTLVKSFIYPGKVKTGYPGEIHLIATIDDGATSGSVRIFDYTNNMTVAELTNITATTPTILTFPFDKTKLPVNKAEFQIHLKRTSAISTKKITFWSLLIDYNP
jgi:hypothetical protein